MKKIEIKIGELFSKLNIDSIDELENVSGLFIKTPEGELTEIRGLIKKSPKDIYEYDFEKNISIKCSDEHLFQQHGITTKAKDCEVIDTINGKIKKIKSAFIENDFVYDISIDEPHLYITSNGVIHHNTSLVNALIKDLDADVMWVNGSKDAGIDLMRGKLIDFGSGVGIDDSPKICVIDEADGIETKGQKALRGVIEEFSKNVSFIFTANYKEKLIEPLRNRLLQFDFDDIYNKNKKYIATSAYKRLIYILESEGIEFEHKQLQPIVTNFAPSIREMIMILQQNSTSGELILDENILNTSIQHKSILKSMKEKSFPAVRKGIQALADPASIYTYMFNNLDDWFDPQGMPQAILIIAKYQEMSSGARDKVIPSTAMAVEIMLGNIKMKEPKK